MKTFGQHAARAVLPAAALFALVACGSDQDSPDAVGEALADAVNSEDVEAIQDLACATSKASISDDFDFEAMRQQSGAEDLSVTFEFIEAKEEQRDKATLIFKIKFENVPKETQDLGMPTSMDRDIPASKENGKWTVCP